MKKVKLFILTGTFIFTSLFFSLGFNVDYGCGCLGGDEVMLSIARLLEKDVHVFYNENGYYPSTEDIKSMPNFKLIYPFLKTHINSGGLIYSVSNDKQSYTINAYEKASNYITLFGKNFIYTGERFFDVTRESKRKTLLEALGFTKASQ